MPLHTNTSCVHWHGRCWDSAYVLQAVQHWVPTPQGLFWKQWQEQRFSTTFLEHSEKQQNMVVFPFLTGGSYIWSSRGHCVNLPWSLQHLKMLVGCAQQCDI